MCLYINEKETKLLKRRFREAKKNGKNYIVCYKKLSYNYRQKMLYSTYYPKKYIAGWNKSNRKTKNINHQEGYLKEIDKGIHVYTTYAVALESTYNKIQILPVRCYEKDLISGGDYKEAVFMKVFITKKDYNKFIKINNDYLRVNKW